ncbi:hypothetical protein [Kribbella sp. CA-293567]|uniref:hypothetical protein n=1 Tax=Kribbella sp. CA-293567 TaxID=3002436 RepID=UPI0022DE197B|nr:hypothetical protein [Kribbella sp. CA-293567]WBQ04512.1 hypothetical protein OX958_31680 [Kribbella sp. CA-293567]
MSARTPKSVLISAWSVPVLVIGQFSMLAVVPVALVLIGTLRTASLRPLRWWSIALAAVYAVPLALWVIGPDRAPSLSKDMAPIFVWLISAAAVAVLAALYAVRRRSPAVVEA